jgi:hypothetical protein
MSTDYTFYTSLTSKETLSEHFSRALGLGRSFEEQPSPLVSDSLWVSVRVDLDEDWAEEAALIGSDSISLVTFVPAKGMAWPDETRELAAVMQAIVALWNEHPESTGAFGVDEQLLMQRLPDAPIVMDQSIADANAEGFNVVHAFDDLIRSFNLDDIKTDL